MSSLLTFADLVGYRDPAPPRHSQASEGDDNDLEQFGPSTASTSARAKERTVDRDLEAPSTSQGHRQAENAVPSRSISIPEAPSFSIPKANAVGGAYNMSFTPVARIADRADTRRAAMCVNCKKAGRRCNMGQPCARCTRHGLEDTCYTIGRKKVIPRRRNGRQSRYMKGTRLWPPTDDAMADVVSETHVASHESFLDAMDVVLRTADTANYAHAMELAFGAEAREMFGAYVQQLNFDRESDTLDDDDDDASDNDDDNDDNDHVNIEDDDHTDSDNDI
ncbi:hypothetical protein BC940DRAFT_287818 [Gongronella butleri]|nr:hypothetical protein BC940DRAFT_287818 [Gongronella butleri]